MYVVLMSSLSRLRENPTVVSLASCRVELAGQHQGKTRARTTAALGTCIREIKVGIPGTRPWHCCYSSETCSAGVCMQLVHACAHVLDTSYCTMLGNRYRGMHGDETLREQGTGADQSRLPTMIFCSVGHSGGALAGTNARNAPIMVRG